MDRLPPTIVDPTLLALAGRVLANDPKPEPTGELRLRFFQPGFSWQALVDFAAGHDVLPPLIFALRERCLLLPQPASLSEEARAINVTGRLTTAYAEHVERQLDLRRQLVAALVALNAENILPVLLKGAVHLTMPWPSWHEARSMRDIDMLVRAEDAERAHVLLKSLGYQMDPSPPPFDRHLPELVLPGHAGTIEIHTEALSFSARHALTTEEVWRHAEDRSFDGASFQVLPPEWHALHGLLHHQLSDRGHVRRLLGIKGLWEFARVGAEIPASGWDSIIAHAEQRTILDVLSSWSVQANRLFGLEAPDRLLSRETGRHHADATFRRARLPRTIRQALFVSDKVRFAFATSTLAFRYRGSTPTAAALRHLDFLWRRRSKMAGRWFGR